jgi:hypothetical protein
MSREAPTIGARQNGYGSQAMPSWSRSRLSQYAIPPDVSRSLVLMVIRLKYSHIVSARMIRAFRFGDSFLREIVPGMFSNWGKEDKMPLERIGPYVEIVDEEGCRHLIRRTSVQWVSDTDSLRNETYITAAGRTIRVPEPLDEVLEVILE